MGYRAKQRIIDRGISNDQEAHKEMFSVLSHQENANQNNSEFPFTPIRMAKIKTQRTWQGCGAKGTFLHCWWECKCVQPLWKSIWHFFHKTANSSTSRPSYTICWHIPKRCSTIPQGHLVNYVHIMNSLAIHNIQKLKTT
jgi:hypothetical protein